MRTRLLIAESSPEELDRLRRIFEPGEFLVRCESKGEQALVCALEWKPHCVLIDFSLSGLPGAELCRVLRRSDMGGTIAIVALSEQGENKDVVAALKTGVDDYIITPCDGEEIFWRVRAVLRRLGSQSHLGRGLLRLGPIAVDEERRQVWVGRRPVQLRYMEFELLSVLLRSEGRVLSRRHLLERVWGYDSSVSTRTVDLHVSRLRKKLGPSAASYIETVGRIGYCVRRDTRLPASGRSPA